MQDNFARTQQSVPTPGRKTGNLDRDNLSPEAKVPNATGSAGFKPPSTPLMEAFNGLGKSIPANGAAAESQGVMQMKTPVEKVKEFQSKTYAESNFSSSTGKGLFDVSLNPVSGRLEVKVNVNFSFIDGLASDFAGLKDQAKEWSKAEKDK